MNKYEMLVDDCIDRGDCMLNYPVVYTWFCYDKISKEIWEQFALSCLEELASVSDEVAHIDLRAELVGKIKIEVEI